MGFPMPKPQLATRIHLLNFFGLLALGCLSLAITATLTARSFEAEIEHIRKVLIDERKRQIQDLIANAYSVLKTANYYEDAQRAISDMRFGPDRRNYFFVVDIDGMMFVHPGRPELVGKVQLDLTDADGRPIIRKMIELALSESGGGFIQYRWPRPGGGGPARKLTFVKYYPEWRWIVGTGIHLDDLEAMLAGKEARCREALAEQIRYQALLTILVLAVVMAVSQAVARRISRPLVRIVDTLNGISRWLAQAAGQVAVAGRESAGGAVQQAASVEETAESLAGLVTLSKETTAAAADVETRMKKAESVMRQARKAFAQLEREMAGIQAAGRKISGIVDTIESVAFQIRLVSLNAAVEAAHAGRDGDGFGAVAVEVKRLAGGSARAAADTAAVVRETTDQVDRAGDRIIRTRGALKEMDAVFGESANRIRRISEAAEQQHAGAEQIRAALASVEATARRHTRTARDSEAASRQMAEQVRQMDGIVTDLVTLVGHNGKRHQA